MALTVIPKYHKDFEISKIELGKHCMHKSIISDENAGEIFCSMCGIVLEERTNDRELEVHHTLSEFMEQSRTGMPNYLSIYDKGLSTNIGEYNVDFLGKKLSANSEYNFRRLRIWDARSKIKSSQKTLIKAFSILNSVKEKLTLSEVIVEKSAYIFRKALEKKITRGRGARYIIAASIYAACREEGFPRSLTSVSEASSVTRKQLAKSYRTLLQSLDLQVGQNEPKGYLTKICNDSQINEKTKRYALELLREAEEKDLLVGRNPLVYCATFAYIACVQKNELKSQDFIAKTAGITAVSIRNTIPYFVKKLEIDYK